MNKLIKSILALLGFYFGQGQTSAQVTKTSVVEHFTNSNCSACAGSNPTFFTNLGNYPNALHISFHPSSPYASCYFSKQNVSENDARPKFFNIFGSTPRFIVNGEVSTLSNMNTKLTAESAAQSNFSIKVKQTQMGGDSVKVRIVITKVAQDTTTIGLLYAAVKEDTVFFTTGNGEKVHRNVFRKALAGVNGKTLAMPLLINDSVVQEFTYTIAAAWQQKRLESIAIVQWPGNKKLINAALSGKSKSGQTLNTKQAPIQNIGLYPNPASNELTINGLQSIEWYNIYNTTGKLISEGKNQSNIVNIRTLPEGIYYMHITSNKQLYTTQFTINR